MTAPSNYPAIDPWLWTGYPIPPDRPATPIAVYRFNNNVDGAARFQYLPTVRCVWAVRGIGTEPGRASFRYDFDGTTRGAPQSIEQALNTAIELPLAVLEDDELAVVAQRADGKTEFLHHGRALAFGLVLDADKEVVEIRSVGIAKDLWSTPMPGATLRNGDDPSAMIDVPTDLVVQFNPKGRPNAVDQPSWATGKPPAGSVGDFTFPTFLDPDIVRDPDVRKPWTLNTAVRYLIFNHTSSSDRVLVPDGTGLDSLLVAQVPKGDGAFDPDDPATFDSKPIPVTDNPWTGRDWPSAVNELVRDKGFGMAFDLGTGSDGSPETTLRIFRMQAATPKQVYLQPRGSDLDVGLSNVAEADVARDITEVANQWTVRGAIDRYEASFVLAPGFSMRKADVGTIAAYDKGNGDPVAYRMFVLDETGEGHYAIGTSDKLTTTPSLDALFGAPGQGGTPTYAKRRRRPIGELFSTDNASKPLRFQLAISTDSTQDPGIWDGTGHWQIIEGGFALLKDRLGIALTGDNPNAWKIGKAIDGDAKAPFPDGVVKVVECLANNDASSYNKPFRLRLTCVVESDQCLEATAQRRPGSVLTRTVARTVDARDRLKRERTHQSSPFFDADEAGDDGFVTSRDDTDAATAEANAARAAYDSGVLEGPIVIPRFTLSYQVGDRISAVGGRNLPFRTDGGSGPGGAVYPVVVRVEHELGERQRTKLYVSDRDEHAHRVESRGRKKR